MFRNGKWAYYGNKLSWEKYFSKFTNWLAAEQDAFEEKYLEAVHWLESD